MPRHKGIGMRKAKKKPREEPSEAVGEPSDPEPAPEPAHPPSPERSQVLVATRVRPPRSPGMKELRKAELLSHKTARVAHKMIMTQKKRQLKFYEEEKAIFARIDGIERAWKRAGRPGTGTWLQRVWKAELEIEKKRVLMLQEMVVAKDSEMEKMAAIGLYYKALADRQKRKRRV